MNHNLAQKPRLDEQTMALRVAKEFEDGMMVNLGIGIPGLAANFVAEGREILFHTENGALGFGRMALSEEEQDFDLVNAGGQFVTPQNGMSIFDQSESFDMVRGGHIDICVLGAFEVSEKGDLANWLFPGERAGNVGGGMDLAFGAKKLIVVMTHTDKKGRPKILNKCSYPLTAPSCVNTIITDIAVIDVTADGLVLKEIAPEWTVEEIQELTQPELIISSDVKTMEL